MENLAQNVVIAAYDLNVPGGFQGLEKGWMAIKNQTTVMNMEQRQGGDLLVPGGMCTQRLENSPAVRAGNETKKGGKRRVRSRRREDDGRPDVSLAEELAVIPGKEFSTQGACKH